MRPLSVFFEPKVRKPDPRELRWRDRSGVVHAMTMSVIKDRGGGIYCITLCGAHNGHMLFRHPKYSPLPVNCIGCLGYESPYPR